MLLQITVWRKGTPCTTAASKPQGSLLTAPQGWADQMEELMYYSGCWAVFWSYHLIAPVFSPLLAWCQVSVGVHGKE